MPYTVDANKVNEYLVISSELAKLLELYQLQARIDEYEVKLDSVLAELSNYSPSLISDGKELAKTSELLEIDDSLLSVSDLRIKERIIRTKIYETTQMRDEMRSKMQRVQKVAALKTQESSAFAALINGMPHELRDALEILYDQGARKELLELFAALRDVNNDTDYQRLIAKAKEVAEEVYDPLLRNNDYVFHAPRYDTAVYIAIEMEEAHNPEKKQQESSDFVKPKVLPKTTGAINSFVNFIADLNHPISGLVDDIRAKRYGQAAFSATIGALAAIAGFLVVIIASPALLGAAIVGGIVGAYLGLSSTEVIKEMFIPGRSKSADDKLKEVVQEVRQEEHAAEVETVAATKTIGDLMDVSLPSAEQKILNSLKKGFAEQLITHFKNMRAQIVQQANSMSAQKLGKEIEQFNNQWGELTLAIGKLAEVLGKNKQNNITDDPQLQKVCGLLMKILREEYVKARAEFIEDKKQVYTERKRHGMSFDKTRIESPEEGGGRYHSLLSKDRKNVTEISDLMQVVQSINAPRPQDIL